MEELSALKEVEEAAIAEAEAAAAEAANAAAGLFDFEDEDESETASPSKKSPEKGTGVRMINILTTMFILFMTTYTRAWCLTLASWAW